MKKIFLLVFIATTASFSLKAQAVKYKSITNQFLVYLLNHIEKQYHYTNNDDLFINIFVVSEPSGSAGYNNCEITNTIYIAVSEDGEAPDQYLYKLDSMLTPELTKAVKGKHSYTITFTYSEAGKKKKAVVAITNKKITICK